MQKHAVAGQNAARESATPHVGYGDARRNAFGHIGQLWPRPFLGAPDQQEGSHRNVAQKV
jgi:hypothetical protein